MNTDKIIELIKSGDTSAFYNGKAWRRLAADVMHDQHNECYYCKARGRITQATMVHHINRLKDRPDLAYSRTYVDDEGLIKINLVAVCSSCHEGQHPDRFNHKKPKKKLINTERW